MPCRSSRHTAAARRGVLLLIVMIVLSLFIVVGAVAITMAIRARESARAFAAATLDQAGSSGLARTQLDAALLRLIRGPSDLVLASGTFESLLEDKYGASQTGTASAASATGPLVQVTVAGLDTSNPAAIAGRVLTFVPAAGDPTAPSSYRILRVNQGAGTLVLANVKQSTPVPLPSVFPCEIVINGREFDGTGRDEPYDAFDDKNPFLTNSGTLVASRVQQVTRPAFGASGATCTVDNDGDGVLDGIWLDGVLPPQRSPDGGQLSFSVSYLVLDLDGRINLNAHGTFARAQVQRGSPPYPLGQGGSVGMGYGPADVIAPFAVSTPAEVSSGAIPARWPVLLQGGTVSRSVNVLVSSTTLWRPTPMAETSQQGRYGSDAVPGAVGIVTGSNPLNPDAWLGGNSPSDLKGQLQVYTDAGSPPTLTFFRPQTAWGNPDTDDALGTGAAAHPYRLRLDGDAPRAAGAAAADAPYTVAEMERILRPFDSDAAQLAPRLAAILDARAEPLRMVITTDSWDTPAIPGTVAQTITMSATAGNPYAVLSPETVAGLRFNLNRPITSGPARQEYFKQLYTLVVTQTGTANAETAAQWAANVIEFRDPDSIMTWYPYDTNPLDGAWTTGTGVWGAERPEMVIKAATKPDPDGNQVIVSLYRPWAAVCNSTSGSAVPTERIDGALGNATTNTLDVTRMDVASSGTNPVWRLTAGGTTTGLDRLITTGTAVGTNADVGQATLIGSSSPTQVVLQRLADPTRVQNPDPSNPAAYNDYVTVDSVSLPPVSQRGLPSRWLHWPNRDLVSHGELLAVQSGSAAMLAGLLFDAAQEASLARANPAILDATIVPTRFVGGNVSVANGGTTLAGTGYENFLYGQLSRWREPGRVNVNTILPNVGNTDMIDDAVWNALVGGTSVPNPVTSGSYTPVPSLQTLLAGTTANSPGPFDRPGTDSNASSAFLQRATAIRLANCATVRSHVFAVWITLRITDSSPNAGPPRFARLFAIVDRSIPVGYAPGRTLNARETVRLVRYLE